MLAVNIKHISFTTAQLHKTPPTTSTCNTLHLFPATKQLSKTKRVVVSNLYPISMVETIRIRAASRTGEEGGCTRAASPQADSDGVSSFSVNGLESKLNNLSKWIAAAMLTSILLLRHDATALWVATGSVLNTIIASLLKKALNQERPVAHLRSDPGMPSTHSQSLFFIATFFVLSLVQWLGFNGYTTFLSGLSIAAASYFASLRVTQRLHTVAQVLVGAILGTSFSLVWFWSWDAIVLKAFLSHMGVRVFVMMGGIAYSLTFILYVSGYIG